MTYAISKPLLIYLYQSLGLGRPTCSSTSLLFGYLKPVHQVVPHFFIPTFAYASALAQKDTAIQLGLLPETPLHDLMAEISAKKEVCG